METSPRDVNRDVMDLHELGDERLDTLPDNALAHSLRRLAAEDPPEPGGTTVAAGFSSAL
jgi:FXSXX-COOH protein